MKCNDIEHLLVEMAEGSIATAEKDLSELHLMSCPDCQTKLASLREVFSSLREVSDEEVPTHYFTNFLPRLRQKIEENREVKFSFTPLWIGKFASPVTVFLIILSLTGLFRLFQPSENGSPLREIIGQETFEEIVALSSTNSEIVFPIHESLLHDRTLEMLPNSQRVENLLHRKIFSDAHFLSDTEPGILNYEYLLTEITDEDADILLTRLNDQSIL
jgi:hypothetical protein